MTSSVLVSTHATWKLSYQESLSPPPKETRLKIVARRIFITVAWPIFFLMGCFLLSSCSYNYFKARWNQHKIIAILTNDRKLEKYAKNRIKCCEKQIAELKSFAIFHMESNLKKLQDLELPLPQKKGITDHLSAQLPEERWKDFPWNKFLNTDFFQKSAVPQAADKDILQYLEKVRTKINYLTRQKLVLSNPEGRLEAIKKIAQMSLVKNAFKREVSKGLAVFSIFLLLPLGECLGGCLDSYLNSSNNARSTYEGNKKLLPAETDLQAYEDLIHAHNALVENDFVVPYISHQII